MAIFNPTNLCVLTMEKIYSNEQPKQIDFVKERDSIIRLLRYNIRLTTEDEMQSLWDEFLSQVNDESLPNEPEDWFIAQHKWQYYQLQFPIGIWSYEEVVEAIIRDKYTASEMEAITNNMTAVLSGFIQDLATNGVISATKWLVNNIDEDNTKHFTEMQAWRKFAKDTAKSYFK